MDLKKVIEKFALLNAVLHKGKADAKAVLGKVIAEVPKAKEDIKKLSQQIAEVIKKVNKLTPEQQKEKLEKIDPKALEQARAPKPKEVRELPQAREGGVITRMPPEPSKYPHIGHALSFLLNYIYAKKYKGKCILRFDDTNPEKCAQEYVDAIFTDFIQFLNVKPDKVVYASKDIPKFYALAEKLIKEGRAYVCVCSVVQIRRKRRAGKPCKCRDVKPSLNLSNWQAMLSGKFKPGEAVLRLKGDMEAKNYTLRDPVIFRIVDAPHYLHGKKYRVWPLYDFESACEEEFTGVTHILRSIEFGKERIELQDFIKDLLGFRKQVYIQYGRFEIPGKPTQGRVIREMIAKGKVKGWDDPRLVTMRALRRRGFVPETFYELAKRVGLSKTPTRIDESLLGSINRQFVDKFANRYFFVPDPVKITVKDLPMKGRVGLKIHPDKKGLRWLNITSEFYISKEDYKANKGKEVRLKDLCNVLLPKTFGRAKYLGKKLKPGLKKIQWVPANERVVVWVWMPDGKIVKGYAEKNVAKLPVGTILQFERFGFCRLDGKKPDKILFIYAHR